MQVLESRHDASSYARLLSRDVMFWSVSPVRQAAVLFRLDSRHFKTSTAYQFDEDLAEHTLANLWFFLAQWEQQYTSPQTKCLFNVAIMETLWLALFRHFEDLCVGVYAEYAHCTLFVPAQPGALV